MTMWIYSGLWNTKTSIVTKLDEPNTLVDSNSNDFTKPVQPWEKQMLSHEEKDMQ